MGVGAGMGQEWCFEGWWVGGLKLCPFWLTLSGAHQLLPCPHGSLIFGASLLGALAGDLARSRVLGSGACCLLPSWAPLAYWEDSGVGPCVGFSPGWALGLLGHAALGFSISWAAWLLLVQHSAVPASTLTNL